MIELTAYERGNEIILRAVALKNGCGFLTTHLPKNTRQITLVAELNGVPGEGNACHHHHTEQHATRTTRGSE